MKKTIKELADELGVTKQTVQYHFKSLPTNTYTRSDKGVYLLKDSAINALTDKIVGKSTKENDKESAKETGELYTILLEQLKEKDQQIDGLLTSQKQLQKLLNQQQVLTLQANKKIAELETSLNVEEEKLKPKVATEEIKTENNESEKKGFFTRLFGR